MARLPLPDEQPIAVNALRNMRSRIAGEIEMHSREIDRLRAELVHLDATMQLFDPETDPSDVPALRRYPRRTEWFARGEVTQRVYEAFREQEVIWPREIAKQAMLEKGIAETDKKVLRDIVARFTNVAYDLTRRGKLVKIGDGPKAHDGNSRRPSLNCFRPLPGRAASSRRNRHSACCASPAPRSGQPAYRSQTACSSRAMPPLARTEAGTGRQHGDDVRFRPDASG